mmetsp:Transcript_997/g.2715  ORF Transcript_997/g.2715 Transcript_997/m.2715 type:complete len:198 (-) Transcript_997:13-606(-)
MESAGFVSFRDATSGAPTVPSLQANLAANVQAANAAALGVGAAAFARPPPVPPTGALTTAQEDRRDLEICNQRLLGAIAEGDYLTYSCLVDEGVTCFEPEACGHLVAGRDFHKYYFDVARDAAAVPSVASRSTIAEPTFRVMGDCAVVCYVRLVQTGFKTVRTEETRVWRRQAATSDLGKWKLVHFHRSKPANGYGA